jgi:hypothetical protein
MKLAYEKLQNDYEKLRKEEADRSSKLQELVYLQKKLFEKRFVFN